MCPSAAIRSFGVTEAAVVVVVAVFFVFSCIKFSGCLKEKK